MKRPPPLSQHQLTQLRTLEPQLRECISSADLERAKTVAARVQRLLLPTGHKTRWMMNQNWLCECAVEAGDTVFAVQRLEGVRASVTHTTRIYLEATTLLAICYVRQGYIEKAKPLISFVLSNASVIGSTRRREQFHKRFILRLEEESILASLRESVQVTQNVDEIQDQAIKLLVIDEGGLTLRLASCIPPDGLKLLAGLRDHSLKALPGPERKLLPGPHQASSLPSAGERMRQALRRVTWRALCDPSHEVYKAWSNGLSVVYDKKWITAAILGVCKSWHITATMLVTTLVALAFKLGANAYCEAFAPKGIMIALDEKE